MLHRAATDSHSLIWKPRSFDDTKKVGSHYGPRHLLPPSSIAQITNIFCGWLEEAVYVGGTFSANSVRISINDDIQNST